jgi:hypothetical protein
MVFPTPQRIISPCQREIKKTVIHQVFLLLFVNYLKILQNGLYLGLTRMLRAPMLLHPVAGRLPLIVDPRQGELEHRV